MSLIKAENLVKSYDLGGSLFHALNDVSLEIEEGEFVSIVGKSGSGKSTLMHLLGLLDHVNSGKLIYAGKVTSELSDKELAALRSAEIGFVFQSFNLLARTKALDNILLPSIYSKKKLNFAKRAQELLNLVDLEDKRSNTPSQLSGGQQQRVAIARALINDPKIILADEPTGNLDSKSGNEVLVLLKKLNNDGKTVIIVTHDDEIAQTAKRLVRIADGKITEDKKI